jgi:antitoxin component YwqK of YwqJK toxin-antitoxin module
MMTNALKYFWILLFLCFTKANAQNMFMCDTSGIVNRNDTVITFSCNYFYNYTTLSKDSVYSDEIHSNTPVTFVGIIKNGKLNGPVTYLRNDSNVIQQGFMKNGLADSTFITYRISMANYKREALKSFFRNGLKEGEETEYNETGVIIYIRNYKEGLLEGDYKHYDDSGNLLTSGLYKKGAKEEEWRENFVDEHYSVFSNYRKDELIDYNWVAFYENGKTFFEGNYDKENRKQGLFKIYDTDGSLKSTESYKNGKRNGYFTEYYKGKPVRKIKYKNDKIVTK